MSAYTNLPVWVTHRVRPVSTAGIAALALAKSGDFLTTVVGLRLIAGLTERNPIAAAVLGRTGAPGLAALSLVVIAAVVLVVEWSHDVVASSPDTDLAPETVYLMSYAPLTAVFATTTVYNAVLILQML